MVPGRFSWRHFENSLSLSICIRRVRALSCLGHYTVASQWRKQCTPPLCVLSSYNDFIVWQNCVILPCSHRTSNWWPSMWFSRYFPRSSASRTPTCTGAATVGVVDNGHPIIQVAVSDISRPNFLCLVTCNWHTQQIYSGHSTVFRNSRHRLSNIVHVYLYVVRKPIYYCCHQSCTWGLFFNSE